MAGVPPVRGCVDIAGGNSFIRKAVTLNIDCVYFHILSTAARVDYHIKNRKHALAMMDIILFIQCLIDIGKIAWPRVSLAVSSS
jgi:hypothetical protein